MSQDPPKSGREIPISDALRNELRIRKAEAGGLSYDEYLRRQLDLELELPE
jgi:hypothetical protein